MKPKPVLRSLMNTVTTYDFHLNPDFAVHFVGVMNLGRRENGKE